MVCFSNTIKTNWCCSCWTIGATGSGEYAALGKEIRRSVEMALFTINNPKIELLFLDTKAGENAGSAAMTGSKKWRRYFYWPAFH